MSYSTVYLPWRLASVATDSRPAQRLLARALSLQGDIRRTIGGVGDASDAYRESLGVIRRLAETNPSNYVFQHDFSVSQECIGDVLRDQGDLSGALEAYRETLAVSQRLAAVDPSNVTWQKDVAKSRSLVERLSHVGQ